MRSKLVVLTVMACCVPGCSRSDSEESPAASREHATSSPVTLSLNDPFAATPAVDGSTEAVQLDDAEDVDILLKSIQGLRAHALPSDPESAREMSRQRNLRIVSIATDVVRICADDDRRQQQFEKGIAELLEARYQMALEGSMDDVEQLYADVRTLNDSDPASASAAEGIYCLAKFSSSMARLNGQSDARWFENYSRWAREFADRFPRRQTRAVTLLFGAGRSCEVHAMTSEAAELSSRLMTEAKLCYSVLVDRFGDSAQAAEAAAVLRRLALPGQKLSQFAGPTLDGGFVNAESFAGRVTVICFWDCQNVEFREQLLPLLQQADQVAADRVRFVGVNLDADPAAAVEFLETHAVPGQQVVFTEAGQTGWNSPLVRFWGVSRSASVWLVDRNGVVSDVDVLSPRLVERMRLLFNDSESR